MAKEKRCAIYNRYSVDVPAVLAEKRGKLVSYCEDNLGISDHELFEEVGSVLEEREVFNKMMARIEQNEFSDVLVCHIDRIYKPGYDPESFAEYVDKISAKAVIHTIE